MVVRSSSPESFQFVLTEAVAEFTRTGFTSAQRLEYWVTRLRRAAEASLASPAKIEETMRGGLEAIYRRLVERGGIYQRHQGIPRFAVERLAPQLRAELDRRILASSQLIRLNRPEAIEKTLRRFVGFMTSVPPGGSRAVDRGEVKTELRKAMGSLPFVERRVLIDQGHKLAASLSEVVARGSNALACIWHSHWRERNYNYREDHKERDLRVYAMRGNWAIGKGLMKVGDAGYYDEITAVGEEPFCRCYAQWVYGLGRLPPDMLTDKGRTELAQARTEIAA